MTKISDRVRIMVENERITPNKFSQKLGYERSQTIHDIINSKSNPSYDFFFKFVNSEFSEIYDLYWLITGEGEMLRDERPQSVGKKDDRDETKELLREKIKDQQKIIELLEEKVEALKGEIALQEGVASAGAAG